MPATCTLNQTDSIYCEFNVLNQTDSILWIQCFESNGVNTLNPILWIKRIQYAKSNGYRTGFTKSCTFSLLYADERKVTKTKSVPFQIMKTCVLQSLTRGIGMAHNTYLWLKAKPSTAGKKHDEIAKRASLVRPEMYTPPPFQASTPLTYTLHFHHYLFVRFFFICPLAREK